MFGKNLRSVRKELRLTQDLFAKPIGVTGSYISDIEKGKGNPSEPVIRLLEKIYRINRHWLDSGEGPMFRGPEVMLEWDKDTGLFTGRGDDTFRKHGQSMGTNLEARYSKEREEAERKARETVPEESASLYNDRDPKLADLMKKTGEILASDTDHSASLAANIRSVHQTATTEEQLHVMNEDMSEIKNLVKDLVEECKEIKKRLKKSDSFIRQEDPEEKKGEILKKRAM